MLYRGSQPLEVYYIKRHLVISDLHIPDQNNRILNLIYRFIENFKPNTLHILGDFLNCSSVGKYDPDPYYHVTLAEEIEDGRFILNKLITLTRKYNKDAQVIYTLGNHEARLVKYLGRNAHELADLTNNDEKLISIPHLLEFKKHNIKCYEYGAGYRIADYLFTHGDMARSKAGFTAHGMLDKYGTSGMSGHTHRLSNVNRTQSGNIKTWIETGCLCNLQPHPAYMFSPDWCNGFAIGYEDGGKLYTQSIKIENEKFLFNGTLYKC